MSTATIESRSPQDPDDIVISAPATDREAVEDAAQRARAAGGSGRRRPPPQRADALIGAADALADAADEVADLMVREVGKPIVEARVEVGRGVRILRYHAAGRADSRRRHASRGSARCPVRTLLMSRRRPRGVAGLITPWNFPFAIPLWKAAPALAYGNAVRAQAGLAGDRLRAALLAELLEPASPRRRVQRRPRAGPRPGRRSSSGRRRLVHRLDRGRARRRPAATARGMPAQCEMGGLNSSIVLRDADLAAAAKVIAGCGDGLRGPEVHGDQARDRGRRRGRGHRRAGRRGRGAADRRPRRRIDRGRPGDRRRAPATRWSTPRSGAGEAAVVTGGARARRPTACSSSRRMVAAGARGREAARTRRCSGRSPPCSRPTAPEQAVEIDAEVPYGLVTSVFTNDLDAR